MTLNSNQSSKNKQTIVVIKPVTIDARETYFDIYRTSKKDPIKTPNSIGLAASTTPAEVATAFPPLNRANIG